MPGAQSTKKQDLKTENNINGRYSNSYVSFNCHYSYYSLSNGFRMMFLTANKARKKALKYKKSDRNVQRDEYLKWIEWESNRGNTSVVVDKSGYRLYDEDYEFFEKLGYSVVRPREEMKDGICYVYFGIISWQTVRSIHNSQKLLKTIKQGNFLEL